MINDYVLINDYVIINDNVIINQWELKLKTRNLLEARENAGYQVGIGCSFAFHWL